MDDRVAVVEKLLKFSNIAKKDMEWEEFDNKMRSTIDNVFSPCHRRVLELQ